MRILQARAGGVEGCSLFAQPARAHPRAPARAAFTDRVIDALLHMRAQTSTSAPIVDALSQKRAQTSASAPIVISESEDDSDGRAGATAPGQTQPPRGGGKRIAGPARARHRPGATAPAKPKSQPARPVKPHQYVHFDSDTDDTGSSGDEGGTGAADRNSREAGAGGLGPAGMMAKGDAPYRPAAAKPGKRKRFDPPASVRVFEPLPALSEAEVQKALAKLVGPRAPALPRLARA